MNTGENFWCVYCFMTSHMRDETAEGNWQTATAWKVWISHALTRNKKLAFFSTSNLQFYRLEILKLLFFNFRAYAFKNNREQYITEKWWSAKARQCIWEHKNCICWNNYMNTNMLSVNFKVFLSRWLDVFHHYIER